MKILLVNVDSRWNMAIRKMYNYFLGDHDVKMIDLHFSGYPHNRRKEIDGSEYDEVYVSNIFDINKDRVTVTGFMCYTAVSDPEILRLSYLSRSKVSSRIISLRRIRVTALLLEVVSVIVGFVRCLNTRVS